MSAQRLPFWLPAAAALGAVLIRLWGWSWRIERRHTGAAFTQPVVHPFWHARMLPLVFEFRDRGGAVLISRHRDGELIARVIERLGFVTARGSSTRGGGPGLLDLIARAREGRIIGITPDGPRGPARLAKPGVVHLASVTGMPIVPIAAGMRRAKTLRSWDGFQVPMPFTRIVVMTGAPMAIPADLAAADVAAWCGRVGAAIDDVTHRADAIAAGRS
jgi:lysophospholipid acyltransferase (LPLAT)-like uncharacterized protein